MYICISGHIFAIELLTSIFVKRITVINKDLL